MPKNECINREYVRIIREMNTGINKWINNWMDNEIAKFKKNLWINILLNK